MQQYVLGFAFSTDGSRVALIRKNKPEWQKGKLNGIGGKVEDGEVLSDAMEREFYEETGVRVHSMLWEYVGEIYGDAFSVGCFCVFSDDVIENVRTIEEEEVVNTFVYDVLNGFHGPVVSNLSWILNLCLDIDRPRMTFSVNYA